MILALAVVLQPIVRESFSRIGKAPFGQNGRDYVQHLADSGRFFFGVQKNEGTHPLSDQGFNPATTAVRFKRCALVIGSQIGCEESDG